jgi:imidazolonepropionase-like amidohydrolase
MTQARLPNNDLFEFRIISPPKRIIMTLGVFTNMQYSKNNGLPRYNFGLKGFTVVILVMLQVFLSCNKVTDSTISENFNAAEPPVSENCTVIANCTLIDGTGNDPIPNAFVVICEDRIIAAGPADSMTIPPDAREINVCGATVLPGFINAHVHGGFNKINLEVWAQAGVTTVRDLAGPSSFAWRDEMAKDPDCALLVAAGPMISVPGGYPYVPWGSPYMLPVTSAADAQNKVAALIEAGADIIKLAVESGENFQLNIPSLSAEEALAAVNTAHEHGTIASAHVLVASDLARAIEAGADDIAHMVVDYLPDSLIDVMVTDSILWIPTLELWHHVGYGLKDVAIGNLQKFVLAGGQVALGTDFDGYNASFQHGMPIHEMEWMLEAGMSTMQVIVAGTRNAARACNLSADLGTLEAGKIADILVVNGDPFEDIHNLANAHIILHRGEIIRGREFLHYTDQLKPFGIQ